MLTNAALLPPIEVISSFSWSFKKHIRRCHVTKNEVFCTVVDARSFVFKIDDGGELGDAVHLHEALVVGLDELDANGVGVVVNLLQLVNGQGAFFAIWGISKKDTLKFVKLITSWIVYKQRRERNFLS